MTLHDELHERLQSTHGTRASGRMPSSRKIVSFPWVDALPYSKVWQVGVCQTARSEAALGEVVTS